MKFYKILEYLITKIKKQEYKLDYEFTFLEFLQIVVPKFRALLKGFIVRFKFKKVNGKLFAERGVKIEFGSKVTIGSNALLKEFSKINALSVNGIQIGDNFSLGEFSIIECTGTLNDIGNGIKIGNNVGINRDCYIAVRGKIKIGDNVIFGPGVKIFSENHNFSDLNIPIKNQGVTHLDVELENDIWLGANCVILPGVKIESGAIIAAGAIVSNDVKSNTIVGGVPAKILKKRS